MNRREAIHGLGALAFTVTMGHEASLLAEMQQKTTAVQSVVKPLPSIVAGVRLVDSEVARMATDLTRSVSPPYLFNHAMRTFIFGSLVGRARGQKIDEEILYLACVLHDLGLTDRFEGDHPFEIEGAEAARRFLEEHGYDKNKVGIVWDGIAMHTSAIGQFKQPEVALVGEGAGADVIEPDFSAIKKADIEDVVTAFPRLSFKNAFVGNCADVIRRHPRAASSSFMRDIRERYLPEFHSRNICDLIQQSPFKE